MGAALLEAMANFADPSLLLFLVIGVSLGLVVGLLPGLSGIVGMSILLPFIFGMEPTSGMAMLIGMAAVVHTADTFPSVLLGVPGSAGSQATIMDGYPMARRGEASRALGAAFASSMVGGLIGAVSLLAIILVARPLVLALGSPELFMLTLLGLSMVGVLSRGAALPGVIIGLLGMLLGAIGAAPATAVQRFTMGQLYLSDGIPLAVLALGLFAIPEVLDLLRANESISKVARMEHGMRTGLRDALREKFLILRSAVLGVAVGVIPGLGGAAVDWIVYGVAKQTTRDNAEFGRGDVRGVIAPESANNAKEGGALIPTLLFGIPGSGTTAVLLGGLVLMGLRAGPDMVGPELPMTVTVVWALAIANVLGALACLAMSGVAARVSQIPAKKIMPFLIVLLVLASYQSTRHWGDVLVLLVLGALGWALKQASWPRAPMLIGFVLAPSAEGFLWISMSRYGTEWLLRPGVLVIMALIAAFLATAPYLTRSRGLSATANQQES